MNSSLKENPVISTSLKLVVNDNATYIGVCFQTTARLNVALF